MGKVQREASRKNSNLIKQPTFRDATNGFSAKWDLRNEHRNSILMTCHYPGIWVVSRHHYRISARVRQTSFLKQTVGGVANCRLFSQARQKEKERKENTCKELGIEGKESSLLSSSPSLPLFFSLLSVSRLSPLSDRLEEAILKGLNFNRNSLLSVQFHTVSISQTSSYVQIYRFI